MRKALLPACAMVGLFLVGCSSSPAANPAPETNGNPTGPSTSNSSATSANVPQAPNPLDMSQYTTKPCSALTEAQLDQLSIPAEPKSRPNAPAGPACEWNAYDETGVVLTAGPITAGSSLAGSYRKAKRGGFENFKPIKVAGYPGYLNWDGEINCTASVGVRNDLLYSVVARVDTDSFSQGEHCEIAKQAAELATKTMSGGS